MLILDAQHPDELVNLGNVPESLEELGYLSSLRVPFQGFSDQLQCLVKLIASELAGPVDVEVHLTQFLGRITSLIGGS